MKTFVVLQGQTKYASDIIQYYSAYPNVIFSTLDDEPIDSINSIKKYFCTIINDSNFDAGFANINRQCKNSFMGISLGKHLGATHILKIRSDIIVNDVLKMINVFESQDDSKLSFLYWCTNHLGGHLCDFINFGKVDMMLNFWNFKSPTSLITPEVLLTLKYFQTQNPDIVLKQTNLIMDKLLIAGIKMRWLKRSYPSITDYINLCHGVISNN